MPRIDIYSDLNQKQLGAIGLAVFKIWTEFATGQRSLGGRRLRQPTGVYASSLRLDRVSKNHVAVFADTAVAPHASILETGHVAYSMLDYLSPGRSYPITRTRFQAGGGEARYAVHGGKGISRRGSGLLRAGRFVPSVSGFARTPLDRASIAGRSNTSGRGPAWTVPAMPAYSPARLIAALFARRVSQMGGTINSAR